MGINRTLLDTLFAAANEGLSKDAFIAPDAGMDPAAGGGMTQPSIPTWW